MHSWTEQYVGDTVVKLNVCQIYCLVQIREYVGEWQSLHSSAVIPPKVLPMKLRFLPVCFPHAGWD